uniref:Centrosomal protein of 104 kDa n=1 Tax=Petromyzon marinus TaxID=7757 RepID=S4R4X6_PETMA
MPRRLGFTVVDASGHEEGYSAVELTSHGPTVQGWRSPRYSLYPQELVLCLEGSCHVQKLQVLSHQFLISSKLEIYIGESQHQGSAYTRLGYVALSDNEKTGFRARELKSVHVDATGRYLKLIIHKNHVNKYNIHNQVGLVAINILGDAVDDKDSGSYSPGAADRLISQYLKHHPDDPALSSTTQRQEEFDPLDDLAFGMYVDPEVAGMIRTLDARKRAAVREEKFHVAKTLKQAIADLHKVGERLGRYEVEKRCAVEQEDYDLAEKKKQQMEEYRQRVYQELRLHNLLQTTGGPQGHGKWSAELLQITSPGNTARTKGAALQERGTPKGMLAAGEDVHTHRSESERMYSTQVDSDFQPTRQNPPSHDDRPIPTVVRQQHKAQDDAGDKDSLLAQRGSGTPEPLSEMALREAGPVIDVFGEGLVAGAYSKTWSYREDALLAIYRQMAELKEGMAREDIRAMLRAAIFLVRRALRDQVTSVFSASLKVLKMLVTQFVPQHRLGRVDLSHCVEGTLPGLMARTGDTTTRHRNAAMSFIQELALLQAVRALQLVPPVLLQSFGAHAASRLAISQLELLLRLLPELGLDGHGLTPTNVMKVAQCGLDHTGADVRETAVRLVLALYGMKREAVRALLPPDDGNTRRNLLYRGLFDAMDRIDGKPTHAEVQVRRKAAAEEAERRKQAEIQVLQQQLSALHEIQAQVQLRKKKAVQQRSQQLPPKAPSLWKIPPAPCRNFSRSSICVFCGERSDSFTDEGLDVHYWRHCPMLQRCEHCKQVVEISGLTAHRLGECERGDGYGKCPRCAEAVPKTKLSEHIQAKSCAPAKPERVANRCPLCHTDFPPGEEAWKPHLVSKEGCTKNPRKEQYLQRLLEAPKGGGAAKSGGAGVKAGGAPKAQPRGGIPKLQPANRNAA